MAKNRNNDLTIGLSGRVGKMIGYRQIGGETEAFRRPGKRVKPSTVNQMAHRELFINATYYAKSVNADPVKRAVYNEKRTGRKSVYNMALTDFIKAPEIRSVNTDNYLGLDGDTIIIRAIDDFKVTAVKVSIMEPGGLLLEQGDAVVQPGDTDWIYTITVINAQLPGSKIICTASDLAGNVTRKEVVL